MVAKDESLMFASVFGRLVAHLRHRKNWSQVELAKVLDTTQSSVSRVERGDVVPDAILFQNLARAFEISSDELYKTIERATSKAKDLAVATSSDCKSSSDDWWKSALTVLGAIGLAGLVGAAVASLIEGEKK